MGTSPCSLLWAQGRGLVMPRALPLLQGLLSAPNPPVLCPGVGARAGQDFKLQQPQDKVSVAAGETLTLNCTTSGDGPIGPVKWLKGCGSENETIYDCTGTFPRVTRAVTESDTDFTIHIRDVRPKDAGTYYCVKFGKSLRGISVFQRGNGTEVSVYGEWGSQSRRSSLRVLWVTPGHIHVPMGAPGPGRAGRARSDGPVASPAAKPSIPEVFRPETRAGPGQSVPFTCTAGGFFPREITVKWLKDGAQISAQQPQVTPGQTKSSYNVSSTVSVTLQEGDVRSQLVCEVHHPTLPAPLRGSFQLSRALRVPPSVQVVADPPSPVEVNKTVNFTCHVKGFYPGDVAVAWLENGMEMSVGSTPPPSETPRGLFELRSLVEVQATEEKNGSVFTCRVVHDAQDPISGTGTLRIAAPARDGLSGRTQSDNSA
uniref:Ig-like domain-containing protein n=1 Tax=Strigops habroptila TaxID=2489341 RepID=A0A672ULQ8_STRHB